MAEQKENAPSFRITYFGFGGRAAPLRCAATLGGVAYEDYFISQEEQKKAKAAGTRKWGGIPEITIFCPTGKRTTLIGQSNTCLRYIGTLSGHYPSNPVMRALCDEICASVEDVFGLTGPTFRMKGDELKKAREELVDNPDKSDPKKLPYWMAKFEARLNENEKRGNKNGYFVGDKVSIADLKAYFSFNFLKTMEHIDDDTLFKPCGKINALLQKMAEDEGMKKFDAQFAAQLKEHREKGTKSFMRPGKTIPGHFSFVFGTKPPEPEDVVTRVVVTGANRGIGLEYVKVLLQRKGYEVVGLCRNPDKAEELKKLGEENKGRLSVLKFELTNDDDIANVAKSLKDQPVDIYLSVAGILGEVTAPGDSGHFKRLRKMGNMTRTDLLNVFNTNCVGPLLLGQALYENVKASNRKQIVPVTSGAGSIGDCGSNMAIPYRCSKATLNMAWQSFAKESEAKKDGVHCLLLNPGWVQTGIGGTDATKTTTESVNQMLAIIDDYKQRKNGQFYNYNGKEFAW